MGKWSNFIDIERAASSTGPFTKSFGVYQIRAVTPMGGKPLQIGRLLKVDPTGIIYIGRSNRESIPTRIKKNVSNMKGYAGVKNKLPKHCLQARAMTLPDGEIASLELALLEKYRLTYGELPPFNLKFG